MSEEAIVKGLDDMTRVSTDRQHTKRSGETLVETWEGPIDKALSAYIDGSNNNQYDDVSFAVRNGKGVVTYTVVDEGNQVGFVDQNANAVWEVLPLELTKDLRSHPYFTEVSGAIETDIVICEDAISRGEQYDSSASSFSTEMGNYYGLRLAGVSQYIESAIILRKTIETSRRTLINVAWEKVNQVVNLNTDINPPSAVLGTLDDLQRLVRGSGGYTLPYSDSDFETAKWEWLKKAPNVRSLAGGRRFEISYEWWGAEQWSKLLYKGGTWQPTA